VTKPKVATAETASSRNPEVGEEATRRAKIGLNSSANSDLEAVFLGLWSNPKSDQVRILAPCVTKDDCDAAKLTHHSFQPATKLGRFASSEMVCLIKAVPFNPQSCRWDAG